MPRALATQIVIAVPDRRLARRLADRLLDERLCACAQTVGPITSRYRWQGQLASAREYLLVVKTRRGLFGAVERVVRALHPYSVPEIAALPLAPVHAPYLAWLLEVTRRTARPRRRQLAARARSSRR